MVLAWVWPRGVPYGDCCKTALWVVGVQMVVQAEPELVEPQPSVPMMPPLCVAQRSGGAWESPLSVATEP